LFKRNPHFQENAFRKVGFAMVFLPTRAYIGAGISPVGSYMKFLMGSVLLLGMACCWHSIELELFSLPSISPRSFRVNKLVLG